jgi:predicted short-subunit dehydrogenase-like oxidoreductase (DUF2520 family)
LGLALAMAFKRSGHAPSIAVTRTSRSAKSAARLLRTRTVALGRKRLDEIAAADQALILESDVVVIATPDDSIQKVARQLAIICKSKPQNGTADRGAPTFLHTSGALTSEVLEALADLGCPSGSMHPLMSISGRSDEAPNFSGIHFSLEGHPTALRVVRRLVRDLGGDSFVIDRNSKPLYHAAALMASPNLTALIDIAVEMMTHCHLTASRARKILLPLIESTVANLVSQAPPRALTGTFKRGDLDTVKVHLAAIASERLTDAMKAYEVLGSRSLKMSEIPKSRKLAIQSLLSEAAARFQTARVPTKRKLRASKSPRRN